MAKTQTKNNKETLYRFKEPSKYNVIMHNDDVTTMDFVVMVLVQIFKKGADEAETIMLRIHSEGSATVGTYYKDIAESKTEYTMALARQEGFPLKLTIEEV